MKRHISTLNLENNTAKKETHFSNKVFYYSNLGKFPQALTEYEEAIKRNPDVAKYHSNMGTVYVKLI